MVYIVESRERAQAVLTGIEKENAFRATLGEPPLIEELLWFDSTEAEVQFWAMYEANRRWDDGGGGASVVVDLRGRSNTRSAQGQSIDRPAP